MSLRGVQRILVPIELLAADFQAALELAVMLARTNDAEITLLHVLTPGSAIGAIVPGAHAEVDLEPERLSALGKVDAVAESLRARGVARVSSHVELGFAVAHILGHTKTHAIDLIVMGTHGRHGLARIWLGSVAELVLRQAPCRVVVVRAPF